MFAHAHVRMAKIAVVTGSNKGIGYESVNALSEVDGIHVISLHDRPFFVWKLWRGSHTLWIYRETIHVHCSNSSIDACFIPMQSRGMVPDSSTTCITDWPQGNAITTLKTPEQSIVQRTMEKFSSMVDSEATIFSKKGTTTSFNLVAESRWSYPSRWEGH